MALKNLVKYYKQGGEGGGVNRVHFWLFWSQLRKCIKICLCAKKVVICGKGKSAEAMQKQIFQVQKYDLVNWKLK